MRRILDAIAHHASTQPDRCAVVDATSRLSYAALWHAAEIAAQALASDLPQDSVLGYLGPVDAELIVALLAAHRAGVTFAHLDPQLPDYALTDLADQAGTARVWAASATRDRTRRLFRSNAAEVPAAGDAELPIRAQTSARICEPALANVPDSAISHLRFTSGSIGRPKGVPLSRRHVGRMVPALEFACPARADDRYGLFGHFWPLVIFRALTVGATLDAFQFASDGSAALADWMRQHRISVMFTYPQLFRQLATVLTTPLPDLHFVHLSGEPLLAADLQQFETSCKPGSVLHNSFGSSEYPFIAAYFHHHGDDIVDPVVPLGRPVFPEEFLLLDAAGAPVAVGETGEIVIRSDHLPSGYHRDPDRTAQVFRPDPDRLGARRYHTGDFAWRDAQGLLRTAGRRDDQVTVRGSTIRTGEVEAAVRQIAGVNDAVVLLTPMPSGDQALICHYEGSLPAGMSERRLRRVLRQLLPAAQIPSHFVAHGLLPRTATHKPDRQMLARQATRPQPAFDAGRQTKDRALQQLVVLWSRYLGHRSFSFADEFFEVGGDSLQAMSMLTALEHQSGVRIPFDQWLLRGASISALSDLLADHDERGGELAPLILRSGECPPTLCFIHGLDGDLADYLALADALPTRHRIVGCYATGLSMATAAANTMTRLAEHCASQVATARGEQPCVLAGYSYGAWVALEAARQLCASGQAPAGLILIDPMLHEPRTRRFAGYFLGPLRRGNLSVAGQRLASVVPHFFRPARPHQAPRDAHTAAWLRHRPEPLRGGLPCLRISSADSARDELAARSWQWLLGDGCSMCSVEAGHLDMVKPPEVALVAALIDNWIAGLSGNCSVPGATPAHRMTGDDR